MNDLPPPESDTSGTDSIHECIEEIVALAAGSIERLADEVGVTYATLYGWATDRRRPSAEHLLELARVTDERSDALREAAARLRKLGKGEDEHPGPLGEEK